jgi:hypothetical protein
MMDINELRNSTILLLYSERDSIKLDPDYQRAGDIWNLEKRQLLIDSIINEFDIPKIYFHKYSRAELERDHKVKYSIIDGRQRLEAIWKFINGEFPLADDFKYLHDSDADLAGLTYEELGKRHPKLKIKFDGFRLSIVTIETDDLEIIEDLFSRLNEAVPLSAAEKRNAFGGPIPTAIRSLCRHEFFKKSIPFSNSRYRHFDLACKFLLFVESNDLVDTKKIYLDRFVKSWRDRKKSDATRLRQAAEDALDLMKRRFVEKDPLLRSVGNTTIYFYLFMLAMEQGWEEEVSRKQLAKFEETRKLNRKAAEEDISQADYDLLEFDRYVQSPNDGYAMRLRLSILLDKVFDREFLPRQSHRK